MKVLVLNAGSSSQKISLYELGDTLPKDPLAPLWETSIDWTNRAGTSKHNQHQTPGHQRLPSTSHANALKQVLGTLWSGPGRVLEHPEEIDVIGHRVVHGGPAYRQSTLVTTEVKAAIEEYAVFAPLQNPVNLEGMRVGEELLPGAKQVAVFDTAFHRTLPLPAIVYPGPYAWYEQGLQRYGFHGINHQYCAHRTARLLGRDLKQLKLVTCHLGYGCSLAAIRHGWSIDTTMGLTPLEGLMMGSRSGSLDPGLLLYLLQHTNVTPQQLDETLNHQSGLKGIAGRSGDMRDILQARKEGDTRATLAFEMYVHRLRECLGAMVAVLGGLDALVFTGGVGENAPDVRAAMCETLAFLGVSLDMQKNTAAAGDQDIATSSSRVPVLVIHAEEDWAIANECWQLTGS